MFPNIARLLDAAKGLSAEPISPTALHEALQELEDGLPQNGLLDASVSAALRVGKQEAERQLEIAASSTSDSIAARSKATAEQIDRTRALSFKNLIHKMLSIASAKAGAFCSQVFDKTSDAVSTELAETAGRAIKYGGPVSLAYHADLLPSLEKLAKLMPSFQPALTYLRVLLGI